MTGGMIRFILLTIGVILTRQALLAGSNVGNGAVVDSVDFSTLDEVVVTATRTPKTLKNVPIATRLITEREIKKADATDIQELLTQEIPGLEFGYAMSQETSLNMNGFGGNAVLFLVDGERLAGETMDNVDYNRLNLGNVGRVEIVKGAASSVYGANAVGGVVNLIAKERTEPWHLNLNSRYNSFGNGWRNGIDLNFNSRKWNSNISLQYSKVKTVRLADPFDTESMVHEIFGGDILNVKERLVFRATDRLRLIARGGYFERVSNRVNYDDHYKDYNGGIRGIWQFASDQNLEFSYSYDQYDKCRFISGERTDDHDYSNRQNIVHALYSKGGGSMGITAGADYMNDFLSTYQFADDKTHSQTTIDAFVQLDWNPLSWVNVVLGVRDDFFSESNLNALTARFAALLKLKPMSIRGSYSGGFRAPTLKEMYMCFDMAGIQMIYVNPDLKPERSNNFNISIEKNGQIFGNFAAGAYSVTLSGFYNYYDSRITTTDYPAKTTDEPGAIYTNEKGVRVMGLDLNARYTSCCGVGAAVSYNYLHTSGNSIDSQFSQPRPHSATWRLDYDRQIKRNYGIYAALSGRYLSKPDSEYRTDNAYSVWKFAVQQRIKGGININLTMDNIFNYRPVVYYWNSLPTTGRSWSVGISIDVNELFNKHKA